VDIGASCRVKRLVIIAIFHAICVCAADRRTAIDAAHLFGANEGKLALLPFFGAIFEKRTASVRCVFAILADDNRRS
jgi:hypothetical protein